MEAPNQELEPDYKRLVDLTRSDGSGAALSAFLDDYLQNPIFQQMHLFANQSLRILDTHSMGYVFVSPNTQEITGYSAEEFKAGGLWFTYKRVPATDIIRLTAATFKVRRSMASMTAEEKLACRFSYDIRFRCKDDTVKNIMQHCHVMNLSKKGNPHLLLFSATDISAYKRDSKMNYSLSLFRKDKGLYTDVIRETLHETACPLSGRELEILRLTAQGFSEKEVGEQLFISDLTVKTHKKNMMHKMQAKNAVDLVRIGISNQWI